MRRVNRTASGLMAAISIGTVAAMLVVTPASAETTSAATNEDQATASRDKRELEAEGYRCRHFGGGSSVCTMRKEGDRSVYVCKEFECTYVDGPSRTKPNPKPEQGRATDGVAPPR